MSGGKKNTDLEALRCILKMTKLESYHLRLLTTYEQIKYDLKILRNQQIFITSQCNTERIKAYFLLHSSLNFRFTSLCPVSNSQLLLCL